MLNELISNSHLEADVQLLLSNYNILPLHRWKSLEIKHEKPDNKSIEWNIKCNVSDRVGDSSGIYVYQRMNNEILYVGQTGNLRNSIVFHLRSSYEVTPGDNNSKKNHRFFKLYPEKLIVYWIEFPNGPVRNVLKDMLVYVLKPTYLSFE
jgi:hypothetical protein